jgi:hypothetical protein
MTETVHNLCPYVIYIKRAKYAYLSLTRPHEDPYKGKKVKLILVAKCYLEQKADN